ncbi:MAG: type II toxin-antitoxin system VapB family antitoxin [Acidobacteriaceae bacterium]|nr:type II toxin-antitoxin system VapB family antitoxin [Acidobacteriaceae bacterium]MBV9033395.1 type II toxin-antitoxin system VapB family antitoxin [Acidobacteriaceae bacterium]MBV9308732.1 type II toxin-antitoxin system VapB family antitoxin [Acidobacteriaceae bacterium]
MRTTVILDDKLVDQAREETGIQEKTALLHAGLKALVSQAASRRLARLGGTQPDLQRISRRRSGPTK